MENEMPGYHGRVSLAPETTEPKWMERGACRVMGLPVSMFFPEVHDTGRDAKEVCAECPVRLECLDYAITHRIDHGIWGGLSFRERKKRVRKKKAA